TFVAAAVVTRPVKAWLVEARLVEIPRTVTGGTGITLAAILALLPRLCIAAVGAKILARTAVGRAARELLVSAKFSLGPVATGAIAITRRPGAEGPIATR